MISVKTNLKAVAAVIKGRLDKLNDPEFLRPVALAMISTIAIRIHKDGKDSKGTQIGEYSSSYLKLRSGNFANSGRVSRGENKGNLKNSGTFTGSVIRLNKKTGVFSGTEKEGTARPIYNRGDSKKVIISLTRQLENDYAVVAIPRGYAIGFNNSHNYDKSQWVQQTYGKRIFDLTKEESDLAIELITDLANKTISS